jgi:hypothetical protein
MVLVVTDTLPAGHTEFIGLQFIDQTVYPKSHDEVYLAQVLQTSALYTCQPVRTVAIMWCDASLHVFAHSVVHAVATLQLPVRAAR